MTLATEETFSVVAPLGLGASADLVLVGASAVEVVAADSLAGAGGEDGSAAGEEEGLVLSLSEVDGEDASDDVGVVAGELPVPFEDDLGVEAGALVAFEGAAAGEEDVLGDPLGDFVGASAETNPTRATKTRARTII